MQDLSDRAYNEVGAILGHGTGNVAKTTNIATDTNLKTYSDQAGLFTLQYPASWTVEYKQPATKFDQPRVEFKAYHLTSVFTGNSIDSIVSIYVQPSTAKSPGEFREYCIITGFIHGKS